MYFPFLGVTGQQLNVLKTQYIEIAIGKKLQ